MYQITCSSLRASFGFSGLGARGTLHSMKPFAQGIMGRTGNIMGHEMQKCTAGGCDSNGRYCLCLDGLASGFSGLGCCGCSIVSDFAQQRLAHQPQKPQNVSCFLTSKHHNKPEALLSVEARVQQSLCMGHGEEERVSCGCGLVLVRHMSTASNSPEPLTVEALNPKAPRPMP